MANDANPSPSPEFFLGYVTSDGYLSLIDTEGVELRAAPDGRAAALAEVRRRGQRAILPEQYGSVGFAPAEPDELIERAKALVDELAKKSGAESSVTRDEAAAVIAELVGRVES